MIREEKLKSTSGKVEECKGDTKKLYSLVRYLTGTKVQNLMPDNTRDEKLANDFADYFIEKIQKIWDNLDDYQKFKPKRNSKVLEKIILARYNKHCDRHNLIPSFHLAYRPKHSCETSMVKLVNDQLWSMERKEATAVAVIDLSAALDMVDHNILIDPLHETFRIGDKALRWFQSYLENRYCKVKIGQDY